MKKLKRLDSHETKKCKLPIMLINIHSIKVNFQMMLVDARSLPEAEARRPVIFQTGIKLRGWCY